MRNALILAGVLILGLTAGVAVAGTMTGDVGTDASERVLVPWAGVACLPSENVQSSHFDGIQIPPAETPEAAAQLILQERASELASQTERAEVNADGDRATVAVNDEAGKAPVVSIGVVRYEEGWLVDSLSQCVASDVRLSESVEEFSAGRINSGAEVAAPVEADALETMEAALVDLEAENKSHPVPGEALEELRAHPSHAGSRRLDA